MRPVLLVALNGFRESRRNRVTLVVFAFAFVMIFFATLALELTVTTFERVLTDVGLGVMGFISVALTVFLGSGLIPKEIERRTIFMVLAKPISRSSFVVGRLLGNVLTVYFVLGAMALLFAAQIWFQGESVNSSQLVGIFGLALEVIVLSSVCFAFAAAASQFLTVVATIGLYFVGHMAGDLYRLASRAETPWLGAVGKALYYVLPNLERLDFKARATYQDPTTAAELVSAAGYTIGYAVVMVTIASVLFSRRDFK